MARRGPRAEDGVRRRDDRDGAKARRFPSASGVAAQTTTSLLQEASSAADPPGDRSGRAGTVSARAGGRRLTGQPGASSSRHPGGEAGGTAPADAITLNVHRRSWTSAIAMLQDWSHAPDVIALQELQVVASDKIAEREAVVPGVRYHIASSGSGDGAAAAEEGRTEGGVMPHLCAQRGAPPLPPPPPLPAPSLPPRRIAARSAPAARTTATTACCRRA